MKAAIDVLMKTRGERHAAILGDMFELGDDSESQHELVGRYAAQQKVELLVAIGENSLAMARGARDEGMENVLYYKDKDAFFAEMESVIKSGDVILFKGSRGMEMDKIVKRIMEQ